MTRDRVMVAGLLLTVAFTLRIDTLHTSTEAPAMAGLGQIPVVRSGVEEVRSAFGAAGEATAERIDVILVVVVGDHLAGLQLLRDRARAGRRKVRKFPR